MGNTIDGIVQAECFRSPVDGCLQSKRWNGSPDRRIQTNDSERGLHFLFGWQVAREARTICCNNSKIVIARDLIRMLFLEHLLKKDHAPPAPRKSLARHIQEPIHEGSLHQVCWIWV